MNDSPHQDHSKRVFYYYLAAILIILVINTIITPMFFKPRVQEVTYTNFLKMVDEGKASKVEINQNRIALLCNKDGKMKSLSRAALRIQNLSIVWSRLMWSFPRLSLGRIRR